MLEGLTSCYHHYYDTYEISYIVFIKMRDMFSDMFLYEI